MLPIAIVWLETGQQWLYSDCSWILLQIVLMFWGEALRTHLGAILCELCSHQEIHSVIYTGRCQYDTCLYRFPLALTNWDMHEQVMHLLWRIFSLFQLFPMGFTQSHGCCAGCYEIKLFIVLMNHPVSKADLIEYCTVGSKMTTVDYL